MNIRNIIEKGTKTSIQLKNQQRAISVNTETFLRTWPSLNQHRYTGETTDMPSNILPAKLTDRMTNIKETKRKLKIGTLNVQYIRANAAFIQDIMKDIYPSDTRTLALQIRRKRNPEITAKY